MSSYKSFNGFFTCSEIVEAVNAQINSEDLGRLFAVVHVAGFQRKVTVNDIIVVETSSYPSVGTRIRLEKVGAESYCWIDTIFRRWSLTSVHNF